MNQSLTKNFYSLALALIAIAIFFAGTSLAQAATEIIYPGNEQGWGFAGDGGSGTWSGALVVGPSGGLGEGSANLVVDSTKGAIFGVADYLGTPLGDITTLSYSTYRAEGGPALALALQLNFDSDLTDENDIWQGRLVYEPYLTQVVSDDAWQNWNTLNDAAGTGTGSWWLSNGTLASISGCTMATPCTWTEIKTAFPNGGVHATLGGVLFKAGSSWAGGFDGNVDNFTIGVDGVDTTYDFEAVEPITDNDNDGVLSDVDKCEGTVADVFPNYGDKTAKNRWMLNADEVWKTNAKPGTMGSFQPTIASTYGCSGLQILDAMSEATGLDFGGEYKFGITKGTIEAWMAGEYYIGKTWLETVTVNAALATGASSVAILDDANAYFLKASGVWTNRGVEQVDAEFSNYNNLGWVDGPDGGYPADLIDLQVNNGFVAWGAAVSPTNTYEIPFAPAADGTVSFRVFDHGDLNGTPDGSWYGDNVGMLSVDIYEDKWVDLW